MEKRKKNTLPIFYAKLNENNFSHTIFTLTNYLRTCFFITLENEIYSDIICFPDLSIREPIRKDICVGP